MKVGQKKIELTPNSDGRRGMVQRALILLANRPNSKPIKGVVHVIEKVEPYLDIHPLLCEINPASKRPYWEQDVRNALKPQNNSDDAIAKGDFVVLRGKRGGIAKRGYNGKDALKVKPYDDIFKSLVSRDEFDDDAPVIVKRKPKSKTPKYSTYELPDDGTRELLTMLGEEAAEVQQRISKLLRFGAGDVEEGQKLTNAQRLSQEIGDFYAVVGFIEDFATSEVFSTADMQKAVNDKARKAVKYMRHASALGMV